MEWTKETMYNKDNYYERVFSLKVHKAVKGFEYTIVYVFMYCQKIF